MSRIRSGERPRRCTGAVWPAKQQIAKPTNRPRRRIQTAVAPEQAMCAPVGSRAQRRPEQAGLRSQHARGRGR